MTGCGRSANCSGPELDDVREDRDRWRVQAERLALGPPNATESATPKRPWWRPLAGGNGAPLPAAAAGRHSFPGRLGPPYCAPGL
jgi:hypothetical protein